MYRLLCFCFSCIFLPFQSCESTPMAVTEHVAPAIKLNSLSQDPPQKKEQIINPQGKTLEQRILPPKSYKLIKASERSFAHFLRHLPLKSHGASVEYHDGSTKPNPGIYVAVVNQEIGKRDLHQCADAIMRLRAEYLWSVGAYEQIHFNFTNGFRVDYSKWMQGKRVQIKGKKCSWVQKAKASNTKRDLWRYLQLIFAYAGTHSLSKELKPVALKDMQIGDVFIKGGFPGHAVLVVDMVEHQHTGEKLFLLAQSYMPAQQTQILATPNKKGISPWYRLDDIQVLQTPEWNFGKEQLKRFVEE